ncbi:MAG TPA: DUF4430 domain-containing protein, partial [Solirubrobacteraceae bacterium]
AALAGVLCALAAGCGVGEGKSTGEIKLTVSRDFGVERLKPPVKGDAHAGETVMRLLQSEFDVKTRYGGGFVQEIDGVGGGREDGRPVDWFYYVNGLQAPQGAAQRKLSAGDQVWWDRHDWTATNNIPAVVGSFPEPFLSGSQGKRFPIRLVCLGPVGRSCDEVEKRLDAEDVKTVARATLPQSVGADSLRLLVGTWAQVRQDVAARTLEDGPGASGVYAKPAADGRSIALLDPDGHVAQRLGAGDGLVAATQYQGQGATWIITGTDQVGLAAAAAALNEPELLNHFAVAVDNGTGVPLPVVKTPQPEATP